MASQVASPFGGLELPNDLTRLAYQVSQQGKSYFGFFHKLLSNRLRSMFEPGFEPALAVDPALLALINERIEILLQQDWQDAEAGIYPQELLFDNAWDEFFSYYPAIWSDTPLVWERTRNKEYQRFAPEIETEGYPKYYLQNFHYQTDGYLSDTSAKLYDLQVDLLFNGTADAMRRRIVAPLRSALASEVAPKVLDVACGTGRTLKMLSAALPQARLHGIDLSPAYLRKANERLSQLPGTLPQLVQANGEELPFVDNYFEAVTSTFLFHELPAAARQNVINECYRVVQPGGTLVLCDSIQMLDSPEFEALMSSFPATFHEPYYRH
ncbi:MAG: class I SAM-dependent methyltransferase, partial [Cyanobacteria bacterium P01_H01_bin.121]